MSSEERVFESTRIISEDEVPPDILEKIRQMEESRKSDVTKIVEAGSNSVNVGALMSAARPKIEKTADAKLGERGTALAAKLVNIAKAAEEQRAERVRSKAKSIVDSVCKGLK